MAIPQHMRIWIVMQIDIVDSIQTMVHAHQPIIMDQIYATLMMVQLTYIDDMQSNTHYHHVIHHVIMIVVMMMVMPYHISVSYLQ